MTITFQKDCGGLNENDLYRLMCLNIWFPIGTLGKELGDVALEEVHY